MKTPSVKLFYSVKGGSEIESAEMVAVEGSGRKQIARFSDGGWCHLSDCFLTESKCRIHERRPPKDWEAINNSVADKLEKMAKQIRK